jgi:hypothetical protein
MKAFFVHDEKIDTDLLVLPETDCVVAVTKEIMTEFISVKPDFTKYQGDRLNSRPPATLGLLVATRKTDGDVCIVEDAMWRQRMAVHLGNEISNIV